MVSAERESRSAVAGSDCAFGERVVGLGVALGMIDAFFEALQEFNDRKNADIR